jgi:hypothetical protein
MEAARSSKRGWQMAKDKNSEAGFLPFALCLLTFDLVYQVGAAGVRVCQAS